MNAKLIAARQMAATRYRAEIAANVTRMRISSHAAGLWG
jgi:hypothetical protein